MTWESFYLVCFLVGVMLSVVSFLTAGLNLHSSGGHHGGMASHGRHGGAIHQHHGAHAHHHGDSGQKAGGGMGIDSSFFNFSTLTAFLAWFGGSGYMLTHYSPLYAWLGLGVAVAAGLLGAYLVFLFLVKVLLSRERALNPADFDMVGVLGRVNSSVRTGGTGEMIFSQEGSRRTCGVRSEDGVAIPRGTEVVVTRYERGLAYVRPWEDALNGSGSSQLK